MTGKKTLLLMQEASTTKLLASIASQTTQCCKQFQKEKIYIYTHIYIYTYIYIHTYIYIYTYHTDIYSNTGSRATLYFFRILHQFCAFALCSLGLGSCTKFRTQCGQRLSWLCIGCAIVAKGNLRIFKDSRR